MGFISDLINTTKEQAFIYSYKNGLNSSIFTKSKPSKMFLMMQEVRTLQASLYNPKKNQITGDSIIHLGQDMFTAAVPELAVSAIGGDNVDTFSDRLNPNIIAYKSQKILIHVGGNSFLAGSNPDYIYYLMKNSIEKLRKTGAKIGYLEIIPLGHPEISVLDSIRKNGGKINKLNMQTIPQFNEKMKGIVEVVPTRHRLYGLDGYMRLDYSAPDMIHVNEKCYTEQLVPIAQSWFNS